MRGVAASHDLVSSWERIFTLLGRWDNLHQNLLVSVKCVFTDNKIT